MAPPAPPVPQPKCQQPLEWIAIVGWSDWTVWEDRNTVESNDFVPDTSLATDNEVDGDLEPPPYIHAVCTMISAKKRA